MSGIIGKKVGMGQIFQEDGKNIPVTYILCEPNLVVQIKNKDQNNTEGFVLGAFPLKKERKNKKFKVIKQFDLPEQELNKGDIWSIKNLGEIKEINITGTSKGKGYQGPVKRYNFSVARRTHGTKEPRHGSTGACASPGRTKKGLKMAGHMGNVQVTVNNRKVIEIDNENNIIAIKGAVPGAINSTVFLKIKK